jgi:hypothetical protein
MAITPYVRIPYASERDRYTGRGYTAQQLALMEQQSARESAYAHDRAQRMADRWSGFGGLLTETLGDLRQSREVREAQALEQERYDAEQARLKRIEDEANRRFGVEADWRRDRQKEADEYRQYVELKNKPLDEPFEEYEIYLWNKFNPGSLRTEAGAPGRVFGDPATPPPPARDDTTVSLGQDVFRGAPARIGERAFGGLFPVTTPVGEPSGGETLAGVARGTRDPETGVDLGIAPGERFFAPTPGPAGPTQSFRPQSAAEVQAEEERVLNQIRYDALVAQQEEDRRIAADRRRIEDQRYEEGIANRDAQREIDVEWRQQTDQRLPVEVSSALAGLVAQRDQGVPRDAAIAAIHANWDNWSAAHPDLKLEDVQDVVVKLWPRPGAASPFDVLNFRGGSVLGGGDLSDGTTLTDQQEEDLGTAEVLVEQGFFASIPEALQSIRENENAEVPVPGGLYAPGLYAPTATPSAPPAPPQQRYAQPSRRGGFTASNRIATPMIPRGTPQPSRRIPGVDYRGAPPLPRGN